MKNKLEKSGLNQSEFDQCLFVGGKVLCIVYVDDLISGGNMRVTSMIINAIARVWC